MQSRIVVGTHVFIAAILSPAGESREVVRACLLGKVVPLMGLALFHEYEDLLSRSDLMANGPLSAEDRGGLLNAFLSVTEWVRIFFLWRPNLPDEADNQLIELAVAGSAGIIVITNLKDLRQGELRFPGFRILSLKQFLTTLP